MICSHGDFDLLVDRLVSCYRLSLVYSVNSLIIVSLDICCCTLHLNHFSLNDYVSLILEVCRGPESQERERPRTCT